jgi:signal transduction histidine kinase
VTGLVSWFVAGRIAAPLRQVRRTAEAIDEEQLAARIPIDDTLDEDVLAMATTFNRMLDRLGSAMESQREFLDDAAHELRTPLTVIRGHVETRGGGSSGDETSARLLIGEVDRMDRLVGDLLMLAKSGRPDFLNRHVVDLDDLVVRVVATASALGTRVWQVVGAADARVFADEQRLTQALMQLAVNAVEHTQPGDTIAVGVRTACSEFELTVTDNGPGIPEEEHERIFDRFQQGNRVQPGRGSGLGLAIVRSIAQAHGGRAEVSTAPGGGVSFRLVLPRHDVAEPDLESEPVSADTAAATDEAAAGGSARW